MLCLTDESAGPDADLPEGYSRPVPPELLARPLRVVVATGDALFARRLLLGLAKDSRLRVAGVASCSEEVAAAARELDPDVVVLDTDLPPDGPAAALELLTDLRDDAAVVVAATPGTPPVDVEAAARVAAFLPRERGADVLAGSLFETAALALVLGRVAVP